MQVTEIQAETGAEDKDMTSGSTERGSKSQPDGDLTMIPVDLK